MKLNTLQHNVKKKPPLAYLLEKRVTSLRKARKHLMSCKKKILLQGTLFQPEPLQIEKPHSPSLVTGQGQSNPGLIFQLLKTDVCC